MSVGYQKADYLISVYTGIRIQNILGVSLLLFPILFLVLSKKCSGVNFSLFKEISISPFPALINVYVIILFLYGIIRENNFIVIAWELYPAAVLLLSYKISRLDSLWVVLGNYWIYLFFTVLVALGTIQIREDILLVGLQDKVESITTATVAYEISPILDLWPMIFLLGFLNKKVTNKVLPFLPAIVYVGFQFFFVKRAPTIRAYTYILSAYLIAAYYKSVVDQKSLAPRILAMAFFCFLLYISLPSSLMERFGEKDTSRQEETLQALTSFTPLEHVFGRGLGGWYALPEGAGVVENFYGPNKVSGKDITHIGITYPYLKGGLLLVFLIALHLITVVVFSFKHISKLTYIELACVCFLIVYTLFRLVEGPISTGALFDTTLFGMTLGRLEFFKRKIITRNDEYNAEKMPIELMES